MKPGRRPSSSVCCSVLVAGTNDIAAGEPENIFRDLEQILTDKIDSDGVVLVATIPRRHDLPAEHRIHEQTDLANAFIEEICHRHKKAYVLDFNKIERGYFTRQGMHLSRRGKQKLAGFVVESLEQVSDGMAASLTPRFAIAPTDLPLMSQGGLSGLRRGLVMGFQMPSSNRLLS